MHSYLRQIEAEDLPVALRAGTTVRVSSQQNAWDLLAMLADSQSLTRSLDQIRSALDSDNIPPISPASGMLGDV